MTDPIRIDGFESLIAKLTSLEQLRRVVAAVKAAAAHIKRVLQEYPPQSRPSRESVYGQTFKTDRQRRYFFYARNAGLIDVPYVRGSSPGSRNIKQTWTIETRNAGLTAEIGTHAPYARLLHGEKEQSRYARAVGWKTDAQVVAAEGPKAMQYIKDAVAQEVAE